MNCMKKIVTLSLVLLASTVSMAQADTSKPYVKKPWLPEISLLSVDSVAFSTKTVAKDKNCILMLFNPDCDHCQKQLNDILAVPGIAQTAQLVMISVVPLKFNKEFYEKNHLEKYPFIYLGQDHKAFCGPFFLPYTIPALAFYNSKGQFVSIHYGNMESKEVAATLKKL